MPTIRVRDATVQTVQVEIHTLRVGQKQVTMGMFRQLQHETLVDPTTVQLLGVPWGHVNYWWQGDGSEKVQDGDLLHVVWQRGDTLRRAIVSWRMPPERRARFFVQERKLLTDCFLLSFPTATAYEYASHAGHNTVRLYEQETRVDLPWGDLLKLQCVWDNWHSEPEHVAAIATKQEEAFRQRNPSTTANRRALTLFYDEALQKFLHTRLDYHQYYDELVQKRGLLGKSLADVEHALTTLRAGFEDYRARWAAQYHALAELPQLFIAV